MEKKLYRHGDVLFEKVEKIPDVYINEKTPDEKSGIVQRGESTGHAHVIANMDTAGVELFSNWRERFLRAEKEFIITHQEHKPLSLPAGNYRIRIAREFDYLRHAARMVAD
jgi:hypothetical protein